jgi:multicomponent Na+:H+ antiporter subunit F
MLQISLYISMIVLTVAMVLILLRLWIGPGLGDRVIALDILMTTGIAYIVVFSMMTGEAVFIEVAVILALIAFLTTVAFSFYMGRGQQK